MGAWYDDDNGRNSGSAYLFHVADSFLRGDVDGNGVVGALIDGYSLLCWGLLDCDEPSCLDAADVDDNGVVQVLIDTLHLLDWAFAVGPAPPFPGPDSCGVDLTDDDAGCEVPIEDCL